MNGLLRVAVCASAANWREQFCQALEAKRAAGYPLRGNVVDLDRHDWLDAVRPYDLVIWKPGYMGLSGTAIFKEKTYFMERHLGKLVVPNFNSIWHFESKIAQSYLFALDGVPTPRTTACFGLEDARRAVGGRGHAAGLQAVAGGGQQTRPAGPQRERRNLTCARPSARSSTSRPGAKAARGFPLRCGCWESAGSGRCCGTCSWEKSRWATSTGKSSSPTIRPT